MAYKGWNVHSYTPDLNQNPWIFEFFEAHPAVPPEIWANLMFELRQCYGNLPAIINMESVYVNQAHMKDPDLRNLDAAKVLYFLWIDHVKPNESLKQHFRETLEDIGSTCLQGISHRLLALFIAVYV